MENQVQFCVTVHLAVRAYPLVLREPVLPIIILRAARSFGGSHRSTRPMEKEAPASLHRQEWLIVTWGTEVPGGMVGQRVKTAISSARSVLPLFMALAYFIGYRNVRQTARKSAFAVKKCSQTDSLTCIASSHLQWPHALYNLGLEHCR